MDEKEIKKSTYTEIVQVVLRQLDSLDSKFNALDARELLLQRQVAKLLGKLEGKLEAGEEQQEKFKRNYTKIGTALALIGLLVQFFYWLYERWPK